MFAERGFHGATTQDIADVLGIRQASLYYYFPSKEGALELVCLQGVGGFFEVAKAIARDRAPRPTSSPASSKSHLSPLIDRSDFVRVFLNERQHLPAESRRRIGKWSRGPGAGASRTSSRKACAAANSAPISIRAWRCSALLGMANAVANWYPKEEVPIGRISDEFLKVLLTGVTRKPPRRQSRR